MVTVYSLVVVLVGVVAGRKAAGSVRDGDQLEVGMKTVSGDQAEVPAVAASGEWGG
jgi:hypothetical protein